MEQSRQCYLDAMRGLAAAIVVVVHYFAAFRPYSVFGDLAGYQLQSTWEILCHIPPISFLLNGHMAVCFFFVLSGYVLSISYFRRERDTSVIVSAAVKRPFRLGGVVLFTVLSSMLIWSRGCYFHMDAADLSGSHAWLGGFWKEAFSWRSALFDTMTGLFSNGVRYNPPLWSIRVELEGSLIVYAFLYLFGKHPYRLWILAILGIVLHSSNHLGFILGMMAASLETEARSPSPKRSPMNSIILLAGLILAGVLCYTTPEFRSNTIWRFLPEIGELMGGYPMLAAILLFCGVRNSERAQRVLDNVVLKHRGRISFALCAVHFIVLGSVSSWMYVNLQRSLGSETAFWVVLLTGIAINFFIAALVTEFVDRPSVQFSGHVGRVVLSFLRLWEKRTQAIGICSNAESVEREIKIAA